MSETIDTLAIEIAANDSFTAVAKPLLALLERLEAGVDKNTQALEAYNEAMGDTEKSVKKTDKALGAKEKQLKKNQKVAEDLFQAIKGFTKALGALGSMILAGIGFEKLVQETAKANRELDITAKNLGMTSQSLATWRSAVELSGGSAQGLTSYLNNLSNGITRLTMQGDTSITPFFNALGINLLDGSQKARKLDEIMLELADKFSTMERMKAFSLAQQMGIDEGTFEMLVQGRAALEEHLQKTAKIYKSNQQDLETARKLTAATAYLNQQFDGLKLMIANAAMPVLLKIADVTNKFFEYLQQHEDLVKGVFFGIAGAMTAVMIPALLSGASAAAAFIAPFLPAILIVVALGTAFGLLYDDYQTWANGGNSLFNWGAFIDWISKADFSVDHLKNAFADLLTGYKSWEEAVNAAKSWLELKGFTKDGKMSIASLAEGFKNVAKEIYNYLLPALDKILNVINLLLKAEFTQAWEAAKDLGKDAWNWAKEEAKGTALEGGVTFLDGAAEAAGKAVDGKLSEAWDSFTKGVSDGFSTSLEYAKKQFTSKGMRLFDIWGGFDPDKDKTALSYNAQNKLMDSKQGFKKSDSKAGIAEQTLLDEMNKLEFSEQEQAMFLATVQHESNDFKQLREIGGYKSVEQMQKANIARAIQDPEGARRAIAQGVDAQFEFMYGGRMGNDQKGDGAKYRGRGAIQITGKDNYRRIGNQMGIDLVNNPELLETNPEIAAKASLVWWENKKKESQEFRNAIATGDFKSVTKGVNNGLNGWDDRIARYNKIQHSGMLAKSNVEKTAPKIDPNRPLGGYVVADALTANQHTFATMQNLSQPQNINNNQKTEVAFNGGIHINSTAGTLGGTAQDLMSGVQNRANVMQFNTGLS